MKILIINTVPYRVNGMSTIIMNLYKYMDKSNIRFDFVVNDVIEKIYADEITANNDRYFILKNRNKNPFSYIKKLSEIIKDGQYDIVHIHGNSALMQVELEAVKKSKIKCKTIVHAHNTKCNHKFLHKILYERFMKSYDYAVACSDAAGEWLYKNASYFVLNNGIEEECFRYNPELRNKLRNKYKLNDKFILLHIGRFNNQKNHDFIIDIFYELQKKEPKAILRLVGEGMFKEKIQNKVKKLQIQDKVEFVGETKHPENEYNLADVFIFPSKFESFGLVTVEAQCSGLPCILSDNVPEKVKITDNVEYLSLDLPIKNWVETILKFKGINYRCSYDKEVIENKFSIINQSDELLKFYKSLI